MRSSGLKKIESERPAPPEAKKRREPSYDERVRREVEQVFREAGCRVLGNDDGIKSVRGQRRACG